MELFKDRAQHSNMWLLQKLLQITKFTVSTQTIFLIVHLTQEIKDQPLKTVKLLIPKQLFHRQYPCWLIFSHFCCFCLWANTFSFYNSSNDIFTHWYVKEFCKLSLFLMNFCEPVFEMSSFEPFLHLICGLCWNNWAGLAGLVFWLMKHWLWRSFLVSY